MDVSNIPSLVDWMRRNIWLSVAVVALGVLLYGGYEFVGGYATALGKSFVSEYPQFRRSVSSYTVINTLLDKHLREYNASRIGIARFHNNIRDIGNNSLFFVTFESILTAPGVASGSQELQEVPAISFAPVLPKLMDNHPVFLRTKDMPANTLQKILMKYGTSAVLYLPINDLNGRLIGMMEISWIYEGQVPDETALTVMEETMASAADRIGAYFSARE